MTRITIIVAVRNAELAISRCIQSILQQEGVSWRCVIRDDASTDLTEQAIHRAVNSDTRFVVSTADRREWPATTRWRALEIASALQGACSSDIVVLLDGDDYLAGPDSLVSIRDFQESHQLLASHGTFCDWDGTTCSWSRDYTASTKAHGTFRQAEWVATHTRAFRLGLYEHLDERVHTYAGRPIRAATDFALFVAVLELAGRRSMHCPTVTYVYDDRGGRAMVARRRQVQLAWKERLAIIPSFSSLSDATCAAILLGHT